MKAYWQLTLAQLRLFGRNRQVLFWTLFFPVFLMLMLGYFLGGGNSVSLHGVVIDADGSVASRTLATSLQQDPILQLKVAQHIPDSIASLKKGDQHLVVVIPNGYGTALTASSGAGLKVYYDETNMATSQLGLVAIQQVVDRIDKQMTQYKPVIHLQPEGVQAIQLRYVDFLVPGIVAMMIMSNNLNGVAGQIASWRERGILRRLQSTPLQAYTFIAAQITARLLLNGAQAIIVLVIARLLFDVQVNGSWPVLLGFVILGTLTFMSLGFIIAGVAKTPESAAPIAGFVSFPMIFLGGTFFPIQNMPEFLQPIVKALPISHLSTALRHIMNIGSELSVISSEALLLGVWLVVAFIVAGFTFKWE